jgi:anti-sigma B factor antagonist
MKDETRDTFSDDLHAELSGVGDRTNGFETVGEDRREVAGFAFDGEGMPLPCAVSVVSAGAPLVIRIHGDIDIHSFPFLVQRMSRVVTVLAGRGDVERDVVIDLIHCTYLDSRGMGLLIKTARDIQAVGGRLSLSHLSPKVHKVFTLTGMDRIFTVIP